MFLLIILLIGGGSTVHYVLSLNVKNRPARLGEFPYHVSIQNADSSYHHCGGVIVAPYYVLTAAHCIDGFNADEFQIVSGTVNLAGKNKTVHDVADLIPHQGYSKDDSWNNDIGLIKVEEPFLFNTVISPAILPRSSLDIPAGTKATVIGFGRTDPHGYTSKMLQEANVLVKAISYCNEKYEKAKMQFRNTQICAQSRDGAGICKGDSGGAFIVNGMVVGISSFTNDDCDHRTYPSIFTKISEYVAWINKHIKLKSKL